MILRNLLLAAAAAALTSGAALAGPHDHDRHDAMMGSMSGPEKHGPDMRGPDKDHHGDRDWRDDRGSWHSDHDRYWRAEYRGFAARDKIFAELRRHHYMRFVGDPYWYQGRYVVKSYDRFGKIVFIEVNPYTGSFIGAVRF